MSPALIAVAVMSSIVGMASFVGLYAGSHHKMDLEQWAVGGRRFGLLLVWLLMAGEIYTIFTFLGTSGWAYSRGGPALNILGYSPLIYVVSFYTLPPIWEVGQKHRLQTQADLFQVRYGSKYLAGFVALIGVVSLLPYSQAQITGLGIIVEFASFGGIHRTPAIVIAFILVGAFVLVSGVRGVAWVSVIKDVLLLFTAVFVGIAVPYIHFGGIGRMFDALAKARPGHLVMPGATRDLGHTWYISTVLVVSFGLYMWPHCFAATFTARSGNILRRNAVLLPLYSITMPLVFFVGFAAVLVLPGLSNGDMAVLAMVRKTFPPWFLGVVGAAGALTAMVPVAMQLVAAATLFAKNLFRPILAPQMSDRQVARLAKVMVFVLSSIAMFIAVHSSASVVSLVLLGLAGVAQLFPAVVLGLFSRRVTTSGVFAGVGTGIFVAAFLTLTGRDPYRGFNAGFIALCFNTIVTAIVSALTPVRIAGFEETLPTFATPQSPSGAHLT